MCGCPAGEDEPVEIVQALGPECDKSVLSVSEVDFPAGGDASFVQAWWPECFESM